ncbi:MAG TPA: xanthine dehydrogenase family protein, partial [Chloroflexota bacterium]|nr:xanthine dehydrogenase family protein [Chloroflexota bacterium]
MRTLLGASLQRPDAVGKVNGAAAYPADLVRPGMLHLKVVFAQRPHARIRDIDPSAALRHPGVVAVLTAADVPYNAYGLIDADQPVLCGDVVRFEGDKVALVVAEGKAAAAEGARLVAVDRYAAIGGAFGGREDLSIQHLLALATWKLRRPTALVWSREESIVGHHKRHPMSIRCRWAATRDGKITAVDAEVIADGGAYASTSVEVVKVATLFSSGCYEVPNVALDGYAVYTNNVPCGAFRGFGAPQAQFAAEVMVTRLAHALGLDPVELRRRNIYREGSIEPTQQPLPAGVSALPVLERCV